MELETRTKLAALLRAAAKQSLTEKSFWQQFNSLVDPGKDIVAGLAFETATHYWGNFHARNLLFFPVKPDRYQIQQGKEELDLIAEGLDEGWSVAVLKSKLRDI